MSNPKNTKLEHDLNQFKLSHYKNADFDSLTDKIILLYNKFDKLKDKKKRDRVILEIYTLYIQSIELLFINSHALSVSIDRFPSALFINSPNLQKFIEDNFENTTKYSTWFLTKIVFTVSKSKDDLKDRYGRYSNLLQEVAKDYLDDSDLLNAYKHGYRITARNDKSVLSIATSGGEHFKLNESDSTIVYFSKEKIDGSQTIVEHTLNFKVGRIFGKTLFVCSLLNNIKAAALLHYKQPVRGKNISSFSITDKSEWAQMFGGSHFRKPVFSLKK